jgi:hypothetical protein
MIKPNLHRSNMRPLLVVMIGMMMNGEMFEIGLGFY